MIQELYSHFLKSGKVSTDTRKIEEGSIFFALKGPNFNANKLAHEAIEKGAVLAVIDERAYEKDDRYFLVDDVLTALQDLARFHRQHLSIPFIGLTGSNGKTTTKELIHAILSKKYNVVATKGNLNNHIGVPLTVLSVNDSHEMAIIEMGANHVGEIANLCSIALPSHGLITNIGKAHLEGFGGIEGVIRGKSELYHHLIQSDGVAWINSQNEILSNMAKRFKAPLFYPAEGDFYHCELISDEPSLKIKAENEEIITTQLIGKYNFENIAVALCIGKYFEVDDKKANKAVAEYSPQNNRSQVIKKGSNTIILDAYNANPNSMSSALENLAKTKSDNKVAILGDMKELGESSAEEHQKIGTLLMQLGINQVYLFGPEFKAAVSEIKGAFHTKDKKELKEKLSETSFQDSTILIKGSRSMSLEEVVDLL